MGSDAGTGPDEKRDMDPALHLPRREQLRACSPLIATGAALVLRLIVLGYAETHPRSWLYSTGHYSGEVGKVAISIVSGHGFGSPYRGYVGPTAVVPPVYTYLLAAVYKLTGINSLASHWVIHSINSIFSAATCVFVGLIGEETVGLTAGLLAAWLWAIFPNAIIWSTRLVWETSLSAFLFALAFWITLRLGRVVRLGRDDRLRPWLAYGALWGVIALVNPALLSAFPFLLFWIWLRQRQRTQNCGKQIFVAILLAGIIICPWIVRNYRQFGQFIFIRDGLGLELNRGIHLDEALKSGNMFFGHPHGSEYERARLLKMGELAYMADKKQEVLHFVAARPLSSARMTVERVVLFWTGGWDYFFSRPRTASAAISFVMDTLLSILGFLGLCFLYSRDRAYAALFAIPLVFYPLVYYVTHTEPRFRHPIEIFIIILSAYVLVTLFDMASTALAGRKKRFGNAAQPGLLAKR